MTGAILSRRSLAEQLRSAAATIQPGAEVVYDIRKNEPKLERLMRPELRAALDDLGTRVAGASVHIGSPLVESEASPAELQRIDAIVASARLDAWKIQRLKPMFEKHWKRTAEATMAAIEKHDIKPSLREKIAEDVLLSGGKRIGLVDIAGDTKRALMSVVNVGRSLGLSPRKTALLIEQAVPAGRFTLAGKQYRSLMIARTETLSAARDASLKTYKLSRTVEKVIAFDGEEFDEICASRNGEEFTIEEAELENGNTHPNCVLCWGPA
jgi:hypothetical protein